MSLEEMIYNLNIDIDSILEEYHTFVPNYQAMVSLLKEKNLGLNIDNITQFPHSAMIDTRLVAACMEKLWYFEDDVIELREKMGQCFEKNKHCMIMAPFFYEYHHFNSKEKLTIFQKDILVRLQLNGYVSQIHHDMFVESLIDEQKSIAEKIKTATNESKVLRFLMTYEIYTKRIVNELDKFRQKFCRGYDLKEYEIKKISAYYNDTGVNILN